MPAPATKEARLPETGGFPDVAALLRLLAFLVSEARTENQPRKEREP
jgi:hypothetical protein